MTNIYPTVLRDNILEWSADAPRHFSPSTAMKVQVIVSDENEETTYRG